MILLGTLSLLIFCLWILTHYRPRLVWLSYPARGDVESDADVMAWASGLGGRNLVFCEPADGMGDLEAVELCDELWVLGGLITDAMADEIKRAETLGLEIKYLENYHVSK